MVAQREREAAEAAKAAAATEIPPYDEEALKEFYSDLKDAEREGEVQRILSAFKLNPYEQLGLRNGAPPEDVRRQYRKVRRPRCAFELAGSCLKAGALRRWVEGCRRGAGDAGRRRAGCAWAARARGQPQAACLLTRLLTCPPASAPSDPYCRARCR